MVIGSVSLIMTCSFTLPAVLQLLASVGGLYTLRHELLEVSGLGSPEQQLDALQALLDVVDAVAR